jgi:hypothetical protein
MCSALLPMVCGAMFASTVTAGKGTLSYTRSYKVEYCDSVNHSYGTYDQYTVNGISYTDSTGTYSFPTYEMLYILGSTQSGPCPDNGYFPIDLTMYTTTGDIVSFSTTNGFTFSATVQYPSVGWLNPKYKIIGVMYAPPGSKSTATYGDNNVVGSSTMFSSSFSTGIMQSVSISGGISIFGITDKETTTSSASYTQEADSSSSVAISQTTSSSTSITGYADPTYGINHDYDYINVWLNPLANFTLYENSAGTQTSVAWNGFSYDLNDTPAYPDMDMIGVELGCLNGDFYNQYIAGTNTNWLTCEDIFNNNFSRTWALNNVDGSGPALTPTLAKSSPPYNFCTQTGTDLYNICQADPFSSSTYGSKEFPPKSGSNTTADGRYTACSNANCNVTIDYEPNKNVNYSQGYSTTLTSGEGYKDTYATSYSLENMFGVGGMDKTFGASLGVDVKNSTTYTWIDQFNKMTNTTQATTASFAIVGPAEGYTGPLEFVVYQDNLYGTFLFYPGN